MINLTCPGTGTRFDSASVPQAPVEVPEASFNHCVVNMNYAPLERRKVYFAWGWKVFLEEVPFAHVKDGFREPRQRALRGDAPSRTKAGPRKEGTGGSSDAATV